MFDYILGDHRQGAMISKPNEARHDDDDDDDYNDDDDDDDDNDDDDAICQKQYLAKV